MSIKSRVSKILLNFGVGVTSRANLLNLMRSETQFKAGQAKFELINSLSAELLSSMSAKYFADFLSVSTSQLGQDLLAHLIAECKREGYFVEFGATNGKDLSNTHILEKVFNWKGILAEPATSWHRELRTNRDCGIETDCVWSESNAKLTFNEVSSLELSTIDTFSAGDMHDAARRNGSRYLVNTITLTDLLDKFKAPPIIDYISIDTEGSEFEILKGFDFDKYRFNFISCEHNFTETRLQIFQLLTTKGYRRVLVEASKFDDWYIHESLFESKGFV